MTTADGPIWVRVDRTEANHLVSVLIRDAHETATSDPAGATLSKQLAARIVRHGFAVRPFIYRAAPMDVVVEFDNVGAFVAEYSGRPV